MNNDFFYVDIDKNVDVESWITNDGQIALNIASLNDDTWCAFLTPDQARKIAAALLQFAGDAEKEKT